MPYTYPPQFDELHSISDLHLGGIKGGQTNNNGELLGSTIDYLREKSPDKRMILVINGDLVDFLIEPNPMYLDVDNAVDKLERIFDDPGFKPFWQSLARYIQTENRFLAITMGNHDVELGLPDVRARLLYELCGDNYAAYGRTTLALDGTGFPCNVAGASVLCVHGNNVDMMNVVDHTTLRNLIQDVSYGKKPKPWEANGGTHMVIDVLNSVKKKIPVIDFLKPESKAVAAVILALDPSQLSAIKRIAPVLVSFARDQIKRKMGFLSGEELSVESDTAKPLDENEALHDLLGTTFNKQSSGTEDVDDLLANAGSRALDKFTASDEFKGDEMLGVAGLLWDMILQRPPQNNLREALLKWLEDDNTFDIHLEDSTFTQIDEDASRNIDFILTGHTHLEKSLPRKNGTGNYFNSGTWIRLIKLTNEMLNDEDKFEEIFKAFSAGTLQALDDVDGLILNRPTVVSIEKDNKGIYGELLHAKMSNDKLTLNQVEGSRLYKTI